jgi:hypothetical protein
MPGAGGSEIGEQILSAAQQVAQKKVEEYIESAEFQKKLAEEYKEKIKDLIERSEKNARWFAALAGLLILAVFTALLMLQYADIRTKQVDLYEKYSDATQKLQKIAGEATALEQEVKNKVTSANAAIAAQDQRLQDFDKRLREMEARIEKIHASVEARGKKAQ